MAKKSLGLYIHVPFCPRKCRYCDFYSVPLAEDAAACWADALCRQAEQFGAAARDYTVDTVFFGGGTPTVLPPSLWERAFGALHGAFDIAPDAEITSEANPASSLGETLPRLRALGVNRLSLGLQSARDDELAALGRLHSRDEFSKAFDTAREAGFRNINIDVMYGLPHQTKERFAETLRFVLALSRPPEHLSVYGLTVEPDTPFGRLPRGELFLPDEDGEVEMYFLADRLLTSAGFTHYEISNFARPGFACRHNLKYWRCEEYLGLGPAAASYFGGRRFTQERRIPPVSVFPGSGAEQSRGTETPDAHTPDTGQTAASPRPDPEEYVMLRLRLAEGLSETEYEALFGQPLAGVFGGRERRYISAGLLTHQNGRWALTPRGFYLSNTVISDLMPESTDKE